MKVPLLISILVLTMLLVISQLVINLYAAPSGSLEMRFRAIEARQQRRTDVETIMAGSFSERIFLPLARRFSALEAFSPTGFTRVVEKKLLKAGGMAGLTAPQFIAASGGIIIVAALLTALFALLTGHKLVETVKLVLCIIGAGMIFPYFAISRKIAMRQASIQKNLPDVLDLMTVSVEAGLSFDGALAKLAEKMRGTLVDEFSRVLQEVRMGLTRRDALRAMSDRCENKDLSMFVGALIQADQLGVSIGGVLRAQAEAIRHSRRNQIEQKATKAPVKILFPLVVCIFPSLFIVLLGPAVLKIVDQLFK